MTFLNYNTYNYKTLDIFTKNVEDLDDDEQL